MRAADVGPDSVPWQRRRGNVEPFALDLEEGVTGVLGGNAASLRGFSGLCRRKEGSHGILTPRAACLTSG